MGKFKSILELLKEEDQLVNELRELKKESTNRIVNTVEISQVVESINYTRECIANHLNDKLNAEKIYDESFRESDDETSDSLNEYTVELYICDEKLTSGLYIAPDKRTARDTFLNDKLTQYGHENRKNIIITKILSHNTQTIYFMSIENKYYKLIVKFERSVLNERAFNND